MKFEICSCALNSCAEEVQQRSAALEGEYEDLQSYFTKDPQVLYLRGHFFNLGTSWSHWTLIEYSKFI